MDDEDVRAAKARFEEMARQAQERASRDQELAARVQAMTASETSPGREVTVTVNHAGYLSDLAISERGMAMEAADLSALILETVRRAGAAVGRDVKAAVSEVWGSENPLATQTASSYDFFDAPKNDVQDSASTGLIQGGIFRPRGGRA